MLTSRFPDVARPLEVHAGNHEHAWNQRDCTSSRYHGLVLYDIKVYSTKQGKDSTASARDLERRRDVSKWQCEWAARAPNDNASSGIVLVEEKVVEK